MKPLAFLFALLTRFVPMETVERESLERDAQKWWTELDPDSSETPAPLAKLKQLGDTWYVRVGLASLFIFATRWIYDYLNPVDSDDDDDDDDDRD